MYYRGYILHEDGRIRSVRELICLTDKEAKQKALQLVDGHDVEWWAGGTASSHARHADKSRQ